MLDSLKQFGLLENIDDTDFEMLAGGVSSDIWKVSSAGRIFCVKRALSKLKVEADWFAPVERNRYEVAWYKVANAIVPGAAPRILAHDDKAMLCAMEYLDPDSSRLWKTELRRGNARPEDAAEVGQRLGKIHAGAANDQDAWKRFPRSDIFREIRLEPYLEATADKHPDLQQALYALSRETGRMRLTVIHGDISPKNILLGPDGPLFLDAECACVGDPAFDIAFCLNHFLLKCIWVPAAIDAFLACYERMVSAYLAEVDWETPAALEQRAARLLPGLFLARVDGKSPVEYITREADREKVRLCARALLIEPPARLQEIADAWRKSMKT